MLDPALGSGDAKSKEGGLCSQGTNMLRKRNCDTYNSDQMAQLFKVQSTQRRKLTSACGKPLPQASLVLSLTKCWFIPEFYLFTVTIYWWGAGDVIQQWTTWQVCTRPQCQKKKKKKLESNLHSEALECPSAAWFPTSISQAIISSCHLNLNLNISKTRFISLVFLPTTKHPPKLST